MMPLAQALMDICHECTVQEKWLLAPSRRVGQQWIDAITRAGQPVVNMRVQTIKGFAMAMAAPEIARRGLTPLSMLAGELLIDRLWNRLRAEGDYLARLDPSPNLSRALHLLIRDLRLAGLTPDAIRDESFEPSVRGKGREIAGLFSAYLDALRKEKLLDEAGLLRLAAQSLREHPLPDGLRVLVPHDPWRRTLERDFLRALPDAALVRLPSETPEQDAHAQRFAWMEEAAQDTLPIFHAVGEINEVREVFRRCLSEAIPLDDVEILYTDAETYIPLIFEIAHRFRRAEGDTLEPHVPVTFLEGIPARYSRPGRALAAWMHWLREDYPQGVLVRMMLDGLLSDTLAASKEKGPVSLAQLAATLRGVPIGEGYGRYRSLIGKTISSLNARLRNSAHVDEDGNPREDEAARTRLDHAERLFAMVDALLTLGAPAVMREPGALLDATRRFLEEFATAETEFDNYARKRLIESIEEMRALLKDGAESVSLDVASWLEALPRGTHIGGLGPRPGCVHAAHLLSGGHSGRRHVFVLGMDDGRFPGAGRQDPLLLDHERGKLSRSLPTGRAHMEERVGRFWMTMARLRGHVTLSFASRDLHDDRDMFPSPLLLALYRSLTGEAQADQSDLIRRLPAAVSFAPREAEECLDESEWWLWRLCALSAPDAAATDVARRFAHLGRGAFAEAERASERFTIYDGCVPEAGADHDPTAPLGPVMSAAKLEKIGRCPLSYFFRYILSITPPEETKVDPDAWLDPLESGLLLHEVFQRFMAELLRAKALPPVSARDAGRLQRILDEAVERYRESCPAPSEGVFRAEYLRLQRIARAFLSDQEHLCKESCPVYLEASIGMPSDEDAFNPLNSPEPVRIPLPDSLAIRACGRLDRIDRVGDEAAQTFCVWDYKTGSSKRYEALRDDPCASGRMVQHALYWLLAEQGLRQCVLPKARVTRVGYLLPADRHGIGRVEFSAEKLANGPAIIADICRVAASGAFVASDATPADRDQKDCAYCDYQIICCDIRRVTQASARKLACESNRTLESFRRLRHNAK